jgi:Asp-tRNA(Asn)/Glu-tRNA(Gln) amidotransferase A subunit family amidase
MELPSRRLRDCLDRIEAHEGQVRAFAALAPEQALADAAASDARWTAGRPLSAIDGLVVGLKDVIETEDMPTGQGSPLWEGFRSGRDAACVQALRQAGAVVLGKCTTTEFASSEVFHQTKNPHDLARTPGGSSSGSAAAVAAGFVELGLGTQVMGSILRPASFCGCVGFKPSFGAVNRGGLYDHLSQSCLGFIGRSVAEVWAAGLAIAERVGGDPGHRALSGPAAPPQPRAPARLALLETAGWPNASDGARAALAAARRRLEAEGVEVVGREDDPELDRFERRIEDADALTNAINAWETRWPLASYRRIDAARVSERRLNGLAETEAQMTVDDYHARLEQRAGRRRAYAEIGSRYDAVLALSATGPAPVGHAFTGDRRMNTPASLLGIPAVSLPVLEEGGLPLGLQLCGRAGEDRDLLEVAEWTGRLFDLEFRTAPL